MENDDINVELTENFTEFLEYMMQFFGENRGSIFSFYNKNKGQSKILEILKEKNEITQKELVSLLDMRPQSASEMIKKLERKGFVTKTKSKEDKRGYDICLTVRGRVEANKEGEFRPVIFETLTEDEKEIFNKIMIKLTNDLQSKVKREPRHRRPNIRRKM